MYLLWFHFYLALLKIINVIEYVIWKSEQCTVKNIIDFKSFNFLPYIPGIDNLNFLNIFIFNWVIVEYLRNYWKNHKNTLWFQFSNSIFHNLISNILKNQCPKFNFFLTVYSVRCATFGGNSQPMWKYSSPWKIDAVLCGKNITSVFKG
jgi:hypothetical protein